MINEWRRKASNWAIAGVLLAMGGAFVQLLILLAVAVKGGATTGGEPFEIIPAFGGLALMGGLLHLWRRGNVYEQTAGKAMIVAGVFGVCLPPYLEFTGSLMDYERWLKSNMPKARFLYLYLAGFAVALLLGVRLALNGKLNAR